MKKILLCAVLIFIFTNRLYAASSDISAVVRISDTKIVKDSIISVMTTVNGVRVKISEEYRIVMEKEYEDGLVSLFAMNLKTGRKPVMRVYFDIIPQSDATRINMYANNVVSPDSNHEELYAVNNKDDIKQLKNLLERIKVRAESRSAEDGKRTETKEEEEKFVDVIVIPAQSSGGN